MNIWHAKIVVSSRFSNYVIVFTSKKNLNWLSSMAQKVPRLRSLFSVFGGRSGAETSMTMAQWPVSRKSRNFSGGFRVT